MTNTWVISYVRLGQFCNAISAGWNQSGVENDRCDQAIPLVVNGDPLFGKTVGASVESSLFCDEPITSPGVWYSLATDNETWMEVGLCEMENFDVDGSTSGFDTLISVFEGSCDSLICVGSNDDFCGYQSLFQWNAKAGVTYYILVSWTLYVQPESLDSSHAS